MNKPLIILLVFFAFAGRARAQIGQYDLNLVAAVWDPNDNNSGSCKNDFILFLLSGDWLEICLAHKYRPWYGADYQFNDDRSQRKQSANSHVCHRQQELETDDRRM